MKVYIWGTGNMADEYLNKNELMEDDIIGFIESKKTKEYFHGKKVYAPNEMADSEYDYILVCVNYYGKEIYDTCKELHIDTEKLILMDNWQWADGSLMNQPFREPRCKIMECKENVEALFPVLYGYIRKNDMQGRYIVGKRNCSDFKNTEGILMLDARFQGIEYQEDYFRYRTFEMIADEILRRNVEGSIAELGVFRGTFARFINAKFSKRRLYLFDTFESFDKEEFLQEMNAKRCTSDFFDIFTKTSENYMLDSMEYPEQCVVRKGLFPETAEGLDDEKFAFVSIDVDFEKSILEGLRYFYPRLNQGGVIFIHDYNNYSLEGVRTAVDCYQNEIKESLYKVPLADWGGTLVIVK